MGSIMGWTMRRECWQIGLRAENTCSEGSAFSSDWVPKIEGDFMWA